MPLFVLILLVGLLTLPPPSPPALSASTLVSALILPKLALMLSYGLASRRALRRMPQHPYRVMRRMGRISRIYMWGVIASFFCDLMLGGLNHLRGQLDWILIDEALFLLPPLLMMLWLWWCDYPVQEAAAEATHSHKSAAHQPWSRSQFIAAQWRMIIMPTLLPMLALLAYSEAIDRWMPAQLSLFSLPAEPLLGLAGAAGVYVTAPWLMRSALPVEPMPEGELRQRLMDICQRERVGVRELLRWNTFGRVINAMVMGVAAPVRYIMLTDALLEDMSIDEVEAVMAHEIGHVRRHHFFWMIVTAAALLGWSALACGLVVDNTLAWLGQWSQSVQQLTDKPYLPNTLITLMSFGLWLWPFGWVSRRLERQADTFAVIYLSSRMHEQAGDDAQRVRQDAVDAMAGALSTVARLNYIPEQRKSWRHGSIAWRKQYLQRLVDRPIKNLAIDRVVRRVQLAAALLLLAIGVMMYFGI